MTQKVLLIHGWGGSNNPHWQAWLAGELAKDYGYVHFLKFRDVEYPHLSAWSNELVDVLDEFKPDVVICHSLANTLWFHLCNEKRLQVIKNLILVAPPSMQCNIDELKSFFPILTPKTLYARDAILVCSDNDPYMDLEEAKKLQNNLKIKMKTLQNAGHINADSNYGEWHWMLEYVKSINSDLIMK